MNYSDLPDYYLPGSYTNSRCPICNSHYEDVGYEETRGKWVMIYCSNCGYVFEVI